MIMTVSYIPSTLSILSKQGRNGWWIAICKPPIWEEYKNPETLTPWKSTDDLIYLINNTPQDDDLVLRIIDKTSSNEYHDDEEP